MTRKTKKFTDRTAQIIILLITGIVLGALVMTQARYFTNYVASVGRDSTENIFRKIQILKTSNDELEEEIISLEKQLEEISTKAEALQSIDKEINKNNLLAGEVDVQGNGIVFEIQNDIKDIWFTDIVNELFASGAQAISVNNIRLTDSSIGFDTLPSGQIMVNGVILNAPYTFAAIGNSTELKAALESSLGLIDRMNASIENFQYVLEEKDLIKMKKV
ncbi:DUF881 domain-containing protein [Patescibacteria group bacterium]